MGSEAAQEFIYDQRLYYPAASNYYGFYSTGPESYPSEWNDHQRFFGFDGQGLHYPDMQTESFPYVYLPSYGYAQSSNTDSPYMSAVVNGSNSQYIGTDQIFTNPSYEQSIFAPYLPAAFQPSSDGVVNSSPSTSFFNIDTAVANHRPNWPGVNYTPATSQMVVSGGPMYVPSNSFSHQIQSSVKPSKWSVVNAIQKPLSNGVMASGSVPHAPQTTRQFNGMVSSSAPSPLRNSVPFASASGYFGSRAHVESTIPRFQSDGVTGGSRRLDILIDQHKDPRISRLKDGSASTYTSKVVNSNTQGNIFTNALGYNRDDFPVDYPAAKFFVIKSYTEDDVHKSIKYNVWSSTSNGNKKLDITYEDARRMSVEKSKHCPIFLFFSVNTSRHFCGVAEMTGHVDFQKSMDFWHQDKWFGCFSVKWHIIKDVPNINLRHIILENNENMPVTSSRDSQEVPYIAGLGMLRIFQNSPLKSSIVEDFPYYEEREILMKEKKSRILGRNHGTPTFVNLSSPSNGPRFTHGQLNCSDGHIVEADGNNLNHSNHEAPNSEGEHPSVDGDVLPKPVDRLLEAGGNASNSDVDSSPNTNFIHENGTFDQVSDENDTEQIGKIDQPSDADGELGNVPSNYEADHGNEKLSNFTVNSPPRADGEQPNLAAYKHPAPGGEQINASDHQPLYLDGEQSNHACVQIPKLVAVDVSDAKEGVENEVIVDSALNSDVKIDHLYSDPDVVDRAGFFTVGSMQINISKHQDLAVFAVGSILVGVERD